MHFKLTTMHLALTFLESQPEVIELEVRFNGFTYLWDASNVYLFIAVNGINSGYSYCIPGVQ